MCADATDSNGNTKVSIVLLSIKMDGDIDRFFEILFLIIAQHDWCLVSLTGILIFTVE